MSRLWHTNWHTNKHGKVVQYPVWAESAISNRDLCHFISNFFGSPLCSIPRYSATKLSNGPKARRDKNWIVPIKCQSRQERRIGSLIVRLKKSWTLAQVSCQRNLCLVHQRQKAHFALANISRSATFGCRARANTMTNLGDASGKSDSSHILRQIGRI